VIDLGIQGVLIPTHRALLRHYRVDRTTSNAWSIWKEKNAPQQPSPELRARLKAAGQLQLASTPQWVRFAGESVQMRFSLPSQALSLLQLSW